MTFENYDSNLLAALASYPVDIHLLSDLPWLCNITILISLVLVGALVAQTENYRLDRAYMKSDLTS